MPKYRVVISLGANLENQQGHLQAAVDRLRKLGEVLAISPVFRTAPISEIAQADYSNAVLIFSTDLAPLALLQQTQKIEADLGRIRLVRNGPRTIDIDLIQVTLAGTEIVLPEKTTGSDIALDIAKRKHKSVEPNLDLILPHPRAIERAFVLVPWRHLEPDAKIAGRNISELELSYEDFPKADFSLR